MRRQKRSIKMSTGAICSSKSSLRTASAGSTPAAALQRSLQKSARSWIAYWLHGKAERQETELSLTRWKENEKLVGRIRQSICEGNISHAYLIEGDTCVDKIGFAKDFLKALSCRVAPGEGCDTCADCRKIDHDNCEDLYRVEADGISVKDDMIEKLQGNLARKPLGPRNMAIIADADTMTIRAQNRLLKTLEEPQGDAVMLLLCDNRENMLETIRSRCIGWHLQPEEAEDAPQSEAEGERARDCADALVDWILDGEGFFQMKQILAQNVKNRDDAFRVLDAMEHVFRDILLGKDARSKLFRPEEIMRYVTLLEEARRDLIWKVNYNYALKDLLIKIGK